MRIYVTIGAAAAMLAFAGCGGPDEPKQEREVMKVEDTAFGPLVTTPEKVEDRTNAAVDLHRENLNRRLSEDEDAPRDEPAED